MVGVNVFGAPYPAQGFTGIATPAPPVTAVTREVILLGAPITLGSLSTIPLGHGGLS